MGSGTPGGPECARSLFSASVCPRDWPVSDASSRAARRAPEKVPVAAQTLALSPRQELALGRQAYKEVLSNPRKYGPVMPADRPECQRVRAIAQRIIHAAGIEPLQREINLRKGYRFEWEVNVLDNEQVNAFCLPGGKIAVFHGLLRVVQNDDQLATVLSHEIAHALAHHSSERVARKEMNQGGLGGSGAKPTTARKNRRQTTSACS